MVLTIITNDSRRLQQTGMVKVIVDAEVVTVASEVVPFVNVDAVPYVSDNLTKERLLHDDTNTLRRILQRGT